MAVVVERRSSNSRTGLHLYSDSTDLIGLWRGRPTCARRIDIRSDNGSEFTASCRRDATEQAGRIRMDAQDPLYRAITGHLGRTDTTRAVNSKLRDEILNTEIFYGRH